MRAGVMTAMALAAVLGAAATPALAGEAYGVYSGMGWNPLVGRRPPPTTVDAVAVILGVNGGSANPAIIGTAANPMPVYGPAMWFRLRSGGYRVVPIE
jgi:hypothetical protein